jgi:hypothetical protein
VFWPGLEVLSFLLISSALFLRVMLTYSPLAFLQYLPCRATGSGQSGSLQCGTDTHSYYDEDCDDGGGRLLLAEQEREAHRLRDTVWLGTVTRRSETIV